MVCFVFEWQTADQKTASIETTTVKVHVERNTMRREELVLIYSFGFGFISAFTFFHFEEFPHIACVHW